MRRIWAIVWKEFLHIIRDPRTLGSVLIIPMLMMFLFAYALTFDVKHVSTVVYDQDKSLESRSLINSFTDSAYFDVNSQAGSLGQLNGDIADGKSKVGFYIPRGFSTTLKKSNTAMLGIVIDGSNPIIARAAFNYATSISRVFSQKLTKAALDLRGLKPSIARVEVRPRVLYNPELTSVNFIVPGLIALFLMMIPAVITSVSIVREKERRTVEQIIVSPVKSFELMLGKITPYLGIAAFDALAISLVGTLGFGVPFRGSVLLMIALTLIYMFVTLGIGILISTIADTQLFALTAAFLITMLPSFLLSGFVFPISSMPQILQYLSLIVPARYYLIILRGIFLKGVGMNVLWPQALALLVFGAIVLTISAFRFRKRIV